MVLEIERLLSVVDEVETEVDTNLKRAQALRQSILGTAFKVLGTGSTGSQAEVEVVSEE